MQSPQSLHAKITDNTPLYFRSVLFLTFFGHGLASLGLSEAGQHLHENIFKSVNYFDWNVHTFLMVQGSWDIFIGLFILSGFMPRVSLSLALAYLCTVAGVAYLFYQSKTGSYFGLGEITRRFAWIFYSVFLLIYYNTNAQRFSLLRIGISFAFLAHGFSSLGYFGLNKGQIELAAQILPEETAKTFMYYTGFSDVMLGALLFTGVFSRLAAAIGVCWLVAVVVLSFMLGLPEGLFRSAFFLSSVYVALDARCHTPLWKPGVVEGGAAAGSPAYATVKG